MAREVYFDPYGSYTRGYDQGTSRQMEVERNAREARNQDFNFYGLAPLQLDNARLENRFNNAAYPYRVNALGYADVVGKNQAAASMLPVADNASFGGDPTPYANYLSYALGYTQQVMPDGSIQMVNSVGAPVGAPITTGAITEPLFRRKEWNERNDTYFDQGVSAANVGVARQNANTAEYQATAYAQNMDNQTRATLAGQAAKAGGQAGIAPWNWIPNFFGTNMPGVTSPNAYTYPQTNAPAPNTPAAMAPQAPQALPPAYNSPSNPSTMFSPPQGSNSISLPAQRPLTAEEAWANYQDSLRTVPNHPMPNLTPEQVLGMQRDWELRNGIMPVQQ